MKNFLILINIKLNNTTIYTYRMLYGFLTFLTNSAMLSRLALSLSTGALQSKGFDAVPSLSKKRQCVIPY